MTEKTDLLQSIAQTTSDYRASDLDPPSPEHVDRWVQQFDSSVQVPILREMAHVLQTTYFSQKRARKFLSTVFKSEELVGSDPCEFWRNVNFLDIQGGGASQKEMLGLFSKVLTRKCGISVDDCGGDSGVFVYLDDAIFSGGRVSQDLSSWIIDDAPKKAELHVIAIATHQGSYYKKNRVRAAVKGSGKQVKVTWWHSIELEDRKTYTDTSDVLRPVCIPKEADVQAYVDSLKYKPHLRTPGQVGELGIFSSDAGRQLLETEFLQAGVRIRGLCPHLNQYQRPLGNIVLDTLGFGSMIVTFRNCPNNAPLALWAGDPWYPLFPRVTNSDTSLENFLAMLETEDF